MLLSGTDQTLQITTINRGFYTGFNPGVCKTTKVIVTLLVSSLLFLPETGAEILKKATAVTLENVAGWYFLLLTLLSGLMLLIACLPVSARVRLGPDDQRRADLALRRLPAGGAGTGRA